MERNKISLKKCCEIIGKWQGKINNKDKLAMLSSTGNLCGDGTSRLAIYQEGSKVGWHCGQERNLNDISAVRKIGNGGEKNKTNKSKLIITASFGQFLRGRL